MLKQMFMAVTSLVALATLIGSAYAADPGFCRDYARAAVREFEIAHSIPGCVGYDLRWHPGYVQHFQWCLGASYEAAATEREARRARLRACGA